MHSFVTLQINIFIIYIYMWTSLFSDANNVLVFLTEFNTYKQKHNDKNKAVNNFVIDNSLIHT